MKILFLRHPMTNIGGTGVFTLHLIEGLKNKKHIIGLWPAGNNVFSDELSDLGVICFNDYNYNDIKRFNWNLIVIQHSVTYSAAIDILKSLPETPHIFVSHSSLPNDQVIPYKGLSRVLTITEGLIQEYNKWGVPEELVKVLYNPIKFSYTGNAKINKNRKIVIVSRLGSDKLNLLRQIIVHLRLLDEWEVIIVGGGPLLYLLKYCSSGNVKFVGEVKEPDKYYRNAELVIGSGRTVIEAVSNKVPVIIAGLRGYGGLLTIDNYLNMKKVMFAGRYRGKLYEPINSSDLLNDITKIHDNHSMEKNLNALYKAAKKDFSSNIVVDKFIEIARKSVNIEKYLNSTWKFLYLKPIFVNNCKLKQVNNCFDVIRIPINKNILNVNNTEYKLILNFNGKKTLLDIIKESEFININEYFKTKSFIIKLWNKKIITFNI